MITSLDDLRSIFSYRINYMYQLDWRQPPRYLGTWMRVDALTTQVVEGLAAQS